MASSSVCEKCEQNIEILNHILKQPLAGLFTNFQFELNCYHLVDVPKSSEEFQTIKVLFGLSWNETCIRQIQRIENPFLLGQYLLKKEKMMKEGPVLNEQRLFHGTKYIHEICSDNFNWRLNGKSKGHKFGQGVSFSPESYYASHYTQGNRSIIVAKVLVGTSTLGDGSTKIPPVPFNSTKNSQGTVIVKYEDSEFYPEYIIFFYQKIKSFY